MDDPVSPLQVPGSRATFYAALVALMCLALMVTGRVAYHGPHLDDPTNTVLKPAYSLAIIWLVAYGAQWWIYRGVPGRNCISALARDSYGIYLSHVLVMQLLSRDVFIQLSGLGLATEAAYRTFAWVATMALSWAGVRLLSLVPGLRWCSGAQIS